MREARHNNQNMISIKGLRLAFLVMFFLLLILFCWYTYLIFSSKIRGRDLNAFAKNRNTAHLVLPAQRGTIYDNSQNVLAQNIKVYTLIAYLDPKRDKNTTGTHHVKDVSQTAKKLAPILGMDEAKVFSILSKDAYQVEFGIPGSALTELKKEEIENLKLPGLGFVPKNKRYYPNGTFLSYVLGYAKTEKNNAIDGEMGLELYYNRKLAGQNGLLEYQKDPQGYKIPNTKEYRKEPVDGQNIHLTIDTNIQLFLERSVKKQVSLHSPDTMFMSVMDAKTGKILGVASEPSFDPNTKKIKSYMNPLVSSQFEPGSTMKIFTYLSSIVKGNYVGSTTFMSGSKTVGPDKVNDWKPEGWGILTYDQGFALSSNVGISNIVEKNLSRKELYEFYSKLGFGKETDFTLPNEEDGKINFKYPLEVMNAGFGQGMTVTPVQMLQAFTSIANEGKVMKPYIVEKIIDPNTEKVVRFNKPEVITTIANKKQVEKVKELMSSVVNCGNSSICTGSNFAMPDLEIMGKTGTAQIAAPNGGGYLKGDANTIKSFVGIFPKDDPKYIVYIVVKRPKNGYGTMLSDAFKEVVTDLIKYGDLSAGGNTQKAKVKIGSYLNKDVQAASVELTAKGLIPVVLGDGTRVINQSVKTNNYLLLGERIILRTDGQTVLMPSVSGWSGREVSSLASLMGIKYKLSGSGYVYEQSILSGAKVLANSYLEVKLAPKIN